MGAERIYRLTIALPAGVVVRTSVVGKTTCGSFAEDLFPHLLKSDLLKSVRAHSSNCAITLEIDIPAAHFEEVCAAIKAATELVT